MTEIYLEKISSTGKKLFWQAINKGNVNTYTHGQVGGKAQTKTDEYSAGKNIGKANETTPAEQALFEMETAALKKLDGGEYVLVRGKMPDHANHVEVSKDFKQPMKAHKWKEQSHKMPEKMFAQPKLDGIRCFADQDGNLFTIKGKPMLGVPHISEAVRQLKLNDKSNLNFCGITYLDGELYSHDLTFEEIISVTKQTKTLSNNYKKVSLFVFDIVTKKPLTTDDRLTTLAALSQKFDDEALKKVKTVVVSKDEVKTQHDEYVLQGYEGIMLRDPKAPYEHKRSYKLQKYKEFIDDEFKIIGFEKSEMQDTLGALWFVDKKGSEFKAGLKMSHARRQEIWNNSEKYVGKMATVRYQELTDKEKVPRFGVTVAIRDYE